MEFKLSQVYFVFFCGFFSSERLQGHVYWKGSHVSDRELDGASLHSGLVGLCLLGVGCRMEVRETGTGRGMVHPWGGGEGHWEEAIEKDFGQYL